MSWPSNLKPSNASHDGATVFRLWVGDPERYGVFEFAAEWDVS